MKLKSRQIGNLKWISCLPQLGACKDSLCALRVLLFVAPPPFVLGAANMHPSYTIVHCKGMQLGELIGWDRRRWGVYTGDTILTAEWLVQSGTERKKEREDLPSSPSPTLSSQRIRIKVPEIWGDCRFSIKTVIMFKKINLPFSIVKPSRSCELSEMSEVENLVHSKILCRQPNIKYIEYLDI